MPGIHTKSAPLIDRTQSFPPGANAGASAVRSWRLPGVEALAAGLENLTNSVLQLQTAARQNPSEITELVVTDGTTGRVIASLGEYEKNGIKTSGGYFSELYAGDPYGDSDPAHAILKVTRDGKVQVGENGWVDVLDPYAASAAWIGTQFDTIAVTAAANNGSGLIRLTVDEDVLVTGDSVRVLDVGGVPNATGIFTITRISATQIDLQNSVFVGTYTSGGTVDRLLHITGAANNGSGLIRITRNAHGYESGDRVNIQSVGGVPNATGQWTIDVITANTFDLLDSTWGGGYTSGGTSLRYFAGGLFQTIAIGPSFEDYRLRAFANGSLRIRNAEIELSSPDGRIVLDPTVPVINFYDDADVLFMSIGQLSGTGGDIGIIIDNGTSDMRVGQLGAGATDFGVVINNGATTTIQDGITVFNPAGTDGASLFGAGDNATVGVGSQVDDSGIILFSGGPGSFDDIQIQARDSNGDLRMQYGSELGFTMYDAALATGLFIDPDGNLNAKTYAVNSTPGASVSEDFGVSLSLNFRANAVAGTPGVGQVNFSAVDSVILNTTNYTFQDGLFIG